MTMLSRYFLPSRGGCTASTPFAAYPNRLVGLFSEHRTAKNSKSFSNNKLFHIYDVK